MTTDSSAPSAWGDALTAPEGPASPRGPLVAGRYRLLEAVGAGGMGTVWRAEDEVLGRVVAVKMLRHDAADPDATRRFEIEARSAAAISHPNVVSVFDYGQEPTAPGGHRPYLVMELVEGRSLAEELAERGTLSPDETRDILAQTALGLAAAHSLGVVHRDVKPANLLLGPAGQVKITDFGIARTAGSTALTRTGSMVGTAQYLSPEQAEGRASTPASDLYSLGVVAYACLTGSPPFVRANAPATMLAHLRDPVPPLPGTTPPALAELVLDLLAKDPSARPSSAAEVAARCRAGAAGLGPGPTEALPISSGPTEALPLRSGMTEILPTPGGGGPIAAWADRLAARFRVGTPRRARIPLVAAAGLLAVVVVLAVALSGGPGPVAVPAVVGQQLAAARQALSRVGLAVDTRTVDSAAHGAGVVVGEDPPAGTKLGRGRPVELTVASGQVGVAASAYVGQPYASVAAALTSLGLHPSEVLVATSADPAGTVVSVTPSGSVATGATVTVAVATTPTTTTTAPAGPGQNQPPGPGQPPGPNQPAGPPGQNKHH